MNKRNIGAALSVVAAVTAGATVYASTINNLESDKNTNSMITPYYTTNNDLYSLVKSDYTNDLKNTAIANEARVVQNTKQTKEEVEKIEKRAQEIVSTTIYVEKQEEAEEVSDEVTYEEVEEVIEEPSVEEVSEVVNESVEETESSDDELLAEAEPNGDILAYDDTNLDEIFENTNNEELQTKEEVKIAPQTNYMDNNTNEVENKEEVAATVKRFVNTEALNVRSNKSIDDITNIVKTLSAGDTVEGVIDGEWLQTADGYVKLNFLSEDYPKALIDSLNKVEEAEEPVVEAIEEAVVETVEEPAVETGAEIEPVIEVVEAPVVAEPVSYGEDFTGWVYNTNVLNVRNNPKTGNIIGSVSKGTKVSGQIKDGWVKFNYNGSESYVSAAYLTTTEPQAQVAPVVESTPIVEEVVAEEETVVEEKEAPVMPAVNNNGVAVAGIASQYAGHPYVWGSSNPAVGFDCSGLMVHSYRQMGISLPHSSAAQYSSGYAVNASNLQPGDLVFFSMNGRGIDHVGMITSSDGTFIHASTPSTGVVYGNVYNNHYQRTFVGARRIF